MTVKHLTTITYFARYKMLSASTWPTWKSTPREGMRNIVVDAKITKDEYECGKTKLFIRNPRTVSEIFRVTPYCLDLYVVQSYFSFKGG